MLLTSKSSTFSNGLIIKVTGKAKDVNKAFSTNLKTATYHSNPVQFSSKKPVMPANLADKVLTVLGVTTFNQGGSGLVSGDPYMEEFVYLLTLLERNSQL